MEKVLQWCQGDVAKRLESFLPRFIFAQKSTKGEERVVV